MFPDLIGLEVSESDLLNQRGDEPLSRIKTFDKEKAEVSEKVFQMCIVLVRQFTPLVHIIDWNYM